MPNLSVEAGRGNRGDSSASPASSPSTTQSGPARKHLAMIDGSNVQLEPRCRLLSKHSLCDSLPRRWPKKTANLFNGFKKPISHPTKFFKPIQTNLSKNTMEQQSTGSNGTVGRSRISNKGSQSYFKASKKIMKLRNGHKSRKPFNRSRWAKFGASTPSPLRSNGGLSKRQEARNRRSEETNRGNHSILCGLLGRVPQLMRRQQKSAVSIRSHTAIHLGRWKMVVVTILRRMTQRRQEADTPIPERKLRSMYPTPYSNPLCSTTHAETAKIRSLYPKPHGDPLGLERVVVTILRSMTQRRQEADTPIPERKLQSLYPTPYSDPLELPLSAQLWLLITLEVGK
ncbi:unnamed protein product [Caenorhabditis nigoni]